MPMLKYGPHTIDSTTIIAAGLDYLLQYGFAKSLQDSVAGLHKKVMAEPAEYRKEYGDDAEAMTDAELADAIVADKMAERFDAIVAGEVGSRAGGTRLTGEAKLTRDVAISHLKAIAVAKKATLPKESEKVNTLIERYLATPANAAKVKAEVAERMATQAAIAGAAEDFDFTV